MQSLEDAVYSILLDKCKNNIFEGTGYRVGLWVDSIPSEYYAEKSSQTIQIYKVLEKLVQDGVVDCVNYNGKPCKFEPSVSVYFYTLTPHQIAQRKLDKAK